MATNKTTNKTTTKKITKIPTTKKVRISLNPQPEIEKKREALAAAGIKLQFKARKWIVGKAELTSLEFSKASAEALVKMAK
ncbi:MAG TPA: hypothetical protein VGI90_14445 [Steroidobacteraceae bacterium]|jgi:hypothetical protein